MNGLSHRYMGSSGFRQDIGLPGHCEKCVSKGHVVAHPDLGCGDVGCNLSHADETVSLGVPEGPIGWAYWLKDHWHLCQDEPMSQSRRYQVYLHPAPEPAPTRPPCLLSDASIFPSMHEDFWEVSCSCGFEAEAPSAQRAVTLLVAHLRERNRQVRDSERCT